MDHLLPIFTSQAQSQEMHGQNSHETWGRTLQMTPRLLFLSCLSGLDQ